MGDVIPFAARGHGRASRPEASGSTIPQRPAGAFTRFRESARLKTRKVSGGKRPTLRQLETACPVDLRPVSRAAAEVPPTASITSSTVPATRINFMSAIYTDRVSAQRMLDVDSSGATFLGGLPAMAKPPNPASTASVAERCVLTREASGYKQAQFAKRVGMSMQAWNNCERGVNRISLDSAIKVCEGAGVTLDWIYRGISAHLPIEIATEIMRLQREASRKSA